MEKGEEKRLNRRGRSRSRIIIPAAKVMDPEAARTARDSLDIVFHMSNILETGLDRHSVSILMALCEMGVNPESLAAVVKELRREPPPTNDSAPPSS